MFAGAPPLDTFAENINSQITELINCEEERWMIAIAITDRDLSSAGRKDGQS